MKAPDWLPYWAVILIQMKMMTIMIRMRNQKDLMVTTISKKTMMNNKMERAHLLNLVHLGKFSKFMAPKPQDRSYPIF